MSEQPPPDIYAVFDGRGRPLAIFESLEAAERYPGPRGEELSPRKVVRYASIKDQWTCNICGGIVSYDGTPSKRGYYP